MGGGGERRAALTSLAVPALQRSEHDEIARPIVALFANPPARIVEWSTQLRATCELYEASELRALEDLLRAQPIQVIVTEQPADVVGAVERSGRAIRILHVGTSIPDALLDAFARGFEIAHAADPRTLADRVRELSRAIRSLGIRESLEAFEVTWPRSESVYSLIDISTGGFAFRVDSGEPLDPLLPGSLLENVQITTRGTQVVLGANAIVRNIKIVHDSEPYYRVGCAFRAATSEPPTSTTTAIRDQAVIAGLVRNALVDGEGITMHRLHDPFERIHARRGRIDTAGGRLVIEDAESDLATFDVVRGTFQTGGNLYAFATAVTGTSPLCLHLPAQLEETQKRLSPRYSLDPSQPLLAELHSVLFSMPRLRLIRDLSTTGFSVDVDAAVDAFPPGLHLEQVKIRIGEHEISCAGRVRNVMRVTGKERTLRCGIELEGLSEESRVQLAALLMGTRLTGLDTARNVTFDELWQFFHDTGFVDAAKQATLAPVMPEVRRTFECLHARTTKEFNAVIMRDRGRIVGHVSGLRVYRRTWMFQHLAALIGHNAAPLINLGALECFAQDNSLEYFRLWFLPESRWPNRVFGGFARKISNRDLAELRSCYPIHVATDARFASPAEEIDVFEAAECDLGIVERYFVEREALALRAEDLTAGALSLREINNAYKRLGLQRRRRILIATRDEAPAGFALLEISSPGLNLSEALSAFRIFVLPDATIDANTVRRALLDAVVRVYRQTGRAVAVGVIQPHEVEAYQALGIAAGPHWMCWTAHRSLYGRFYDHVDRTFKVLRRRAARAKRSPRS